MLPESIQIGAHVYSLTLVGRKKLQKNHTAEVDNEQNQIRIYQKCTASRRIEVLFHEVIHAILAGTQFPMEEVTCTILGEGLTQLIRDNPELIKHVQDTLAE